MTRHAAVQLICAYGSFLSIGSLLQMFLDRYKINFIEGDLINIAPYRWIYWGTCIPKGGQPHAYFEYALVRLPAWEWSFMDFGRRQGWMQVCLLRFNHRWSVTRMPCQ